MYLRTHESQIRHPDTGRESKDTEHSPRHRSKPDHRTCSYHLTDRNEPTGNKMDQGILETLLEYEVKTRR